MRARNGSRGGALWVAALALAWVQAAAAQGDRFSNVGLFVGGGAQLPQTIRDAQRQSIREPVMVSAQALGQAKLSNVFVAISNHLFVFGGQVFQAARIDDGDGRGITMVEGCTPQAAAGVQQQTFRVAQVLDKTTVLMADADAAVRLPSTAGIVDGQRMAAWLMPGAETLDFVTVLGANRRVRVLTAVEVQPATFEQFSAALAAGQRFLCILQGPATCPACEGSKFTMAKNRNAKIVCPTCSGKGAVQTALAHSLGK